MADSIVFGFWFHRGLGSVQFTFELFNTPASPLATIQASAEERKSPRDASFGGSESLIHNNARADGVFRTA